jgi:hypothetical protein
MLRIGTKKEYRKAIGCIVKEARKKIQLCRKFLNPNDVKEDMEHCVWVSALPLIKSPRIALDVLRFTNNLHAFTFRNGYKNVCCENGLEGKDRLVMVDWQMIALESIKQDVYERLGREIKKLDNEIDAG